MNIPGILFLFLIVFAVFGLLPVLLGRKAVRSKAARVALVSLSLLFAGLGVMSLSEQGVLRDRAKGERYALPPSAPGRLLIRPIRGFHDLAGKLVRKDSPHEPPAFASELMAQFRWRLSGSVEPVRLWAEGGPWKSHDVVYGLSHGNEPVLLEYEVNENTRPLLEAVDFHVGPWGHALEDVAIAEWLGGFYPIPLFIAALLGPIVWALSRMKPI